MSNEQLRAILGKEGNAIIGSMSSIFFNMRTSSGVAQILNFFGRGSPETKGPNSGGNHICLQRRIGIYTFLLRSELFP